MKKRYTVWVYNLKHPEFDHMAVSSFWFFGSARRRAISFRQFAYRYYGTLYGLYIRDNKGRQWDV